MLRSSDGVYSKLLIFVICVAALIALGTFFIVGYFFGQSITEEKYYEREFEKVVAQPVEDKMDGSTAGANAVRLEDIVNHNYFLPMYMQTDLQWANLEYGSGTIADTGCGLCCGAMAVQQITGFTVTPKDLANMSNGSMLSNGINDLSKIVGFIYNSYGAENAIEISDEITDIEAVYEMVNNDWILFGSCYGTIGDFETSDAGHIVLIYDVDETGFYIRDPYCITNNRHYDFEEFNNIDWSHFYGLRGEHVVERN